MAARTAASARRSASPPRVDLRMPPDSEVIRFNKNLRSPKADRMRMLRQQHRNASLSYYSPNASMLEESMYVGDSAAFSDLEEPSITDTLLTGADAASPGSCSRVPELIKSMRSSSIADSMPPMPAKGQAADGRAGSSPLKDFRDTLDRTGAVRSSVLDGGGSSTHTWAVSCSTASLLRGGSSQLSSPGRQSHMRTAGSTMQRVSRVQLAVSGEDAGEARTKLHRLERYVGLP